MGLGKQLKGMTKEYLRDPKAQYFKYLEKILNLYSGSGVSKIEVSKYVQRWANDDKKP